MELESPDFNALSLLIKLRLSDSLLLTKMTLSGTLTSIDKFAFSIFFVGDSCD